LANNTIRGTRKENMEEIINYLNEKLNEFNYKKLIIPTILLLIYVGGFTYLYSLINNKKNEVKEEEPVVEEVIPIKNEIYVDIKGYVNKPGVYKIDSGTRVIDAINKAGGLKKDANTRFINLAKEINDGDVIVIYSNSEIKKAQKQDVIYVETPCVCEEVKNDACYKEETTSNTSKININTASLDDLKKLNGIGDAKAKAIIEYRTKNGNFKSIEDILKVSGISQTIYAKIKENITV
jgi:competence protein ComEA